MKMSVEVRNHTFRQGKWAVVISPEPSGTLGERRYCPGMDFRGSFAVGRSRGGAQRRPVPGSCHLGREEPEPVA